jgi:U3 small nucleolar RNA-associated protein 21
MPPRPNKRSRKTVTNSNADAGPSTSTIARGPRLFAPFRALGFVCDDVPFVMFVHQPKGALASPTVNVVTSVGRSWMMWDMAKMTLLFVGECQISGSKPWGRRLRMVGPDAGENISSLGMTGTGVYVVAGPRVTKYIRGKQVSCVSTSEEK